MWLAEQTELAPPSGCLLGLVRRKREKKASRSSQPGSSSQLAALPQAEVSTSSETGSSSAASAEATRWSNTSDGINRQQPQHDVSLPARQPVLQHTAMGVTSTAHACSSCNDRLVGSTYSGSGAALSCPLYCSVCALVNNTPLPPNEGSSSMSAFRISAQQEQEPEPTAHFSAPTFMSVVDMSKNTTAVPLRSAITMCANAVLPGAPAAPQQKEAQPEGKEEQQGHLLLPMPASSPSKPSAEDQSEPTRSSSSSNRLHHLTAVPTSRFAPGRQRSLPYVHDQHLSSTHYAAATATAIEAHISEPASTVFSQRQPLPRAFASAAQSPVLPPCNVTGHTSWPPIATALLSHSSFTHATAPHKLVLQPLVTSAPADLLHSVASLQQQQHDAGNSSSAGGRYPPQLTLPPVIHGTNDKAKHTDALAQRLSSGVPTSSGNRLVISQAETADEYQDSVLLSMLLQEALVLGGSGSEPNSAEYQLPQHHAIAIESDRAIGVAGAAGAWAAASAQHAQLPQALLSSGGGVPADLAMANSSGGGGPGWAELTAPAEGWPDVTLVEMLGEMLGLDLGASHGVKEGESANSSGSSGMSRHLPVPSPWLGFGTAASPRSGSGVTLASSASAPAVMVSGSGSGNTSGVVRSVTVAGVPLEVSSAMRAWLEQAKAQARQQRAATTGARSNSGSDASTWLQQSAPLPQSSGRSSGGSGGRHYGSASRSVRGSRVGSCMLSLVGSTTDLMSIAEDEEGELNQSSAANAAGKATDEEQDLVVTAGGRFGDPGAEFSDGCLHLLPCDTSPATLL